MRTFQQPEPAPKFTHDCRECVYIGHESGHDVYICPRGDPTIIARYGNDGPDYFSGAEFFTMGTFFRTLEHDEYGRARAPMHPTNAGAAAICRWAIRVLSGDGCQFCGGAKGGTPGNENVFNGVVVCDYCTVLLRKAGL